MLKSTFKNTWTTIKNNKAKFATLIVIQLLFIFIISIAAYFTIIPAMEEGKRGVDVYDKIAGQDPDQPKLLQNDAIKIYQSFERMLSYFAKGGMVIAIAYIIVNGAAWLIAFSMLKKANFKTYLNIVLIGTLVALSFQQLITSYLKTALTGINEAQYLPTGLSIVVIVLITFFSYLVVGLASNNIQALPKKILTLIVNKGHLCLLFFIINILLIYTPFAIFMTSIEGNLAVPLIAIFTAIALVAYTKVLWLEAITNLE